MTPLLLPSYSSLNGILTALAICKRDKFISEEKIISGEVKYSKDHLKSNLLIKPMLKTC